MAATEIAPSPPSSAAIGAQPYLAAVRAEPGDVIFVYGGGAGSWVTRLGQSLIRGLSTGVFRPARFSHVALVIAPEVALHAAPGAVRAEPIDEIMPAHPNAQVRVVRMVDPPLSTADQDRLVAAAKYYFAEKYAFFYGQHSLGFSRLARALGYTGQRLTQPFCSHLVADAYERIGRPVGTLAADQTLPLDLEEACVEPGWRDVTANYYQAALPAAALGDFDPALQAQMAVFTAGRTKAERDIARIGAAMPGFEHQAAMGAASIVGVAVPAAKISLGLALRGAETPALYLQTAEELLLNDLAELDAHYALTEGAPASLAGTTAANLKALFPRLAEGEAPYEGMQTLAELSESDRQSTMLYFAARTVRLRTLFLASGVALGLFELDREIWNGVTPDLAWPYLSKMPLLSARRAARLKAAAPRVVGDESEEPLGRALLDVIALHGTLSDVRRQVEARRRARATAACPGPAGIKKGRK